MRGKHLQRPGQAPREGIRLGQLQVQVNPVRRRLSYHPRRPPQQTDGPQPKLAGFSIRANGESALPGLRQMGQRQRGLVAEVVMVSQLGRIGVRLVGHQIIGNLAMYPLPAARLICS